MPVTLWSRAYGYLYWQCWKALQLERYQHSDNKKLMLNESIAGNFRSRPSSGSSGSGMIRWYRSPQLMNHSATWMVGSKLLPGYLYLISCLAWTPTVYWMKCCQQVNWCDWHEYVRVEVNVEVVNRIRWLGKSLENSFWWLLLYMNC